MTSFDDRALRHEPFVPILSPAQPSKHRTGFRFWGAAGGAGPKGTKFIRPSGNPGEKIQRLRSSGAEDGNWVGENIVPSLSPFTASAHETPLFPGQRYQHALPAQGENYSNPTAGPKGGDIAECSPLRPDAERQSVSS